MSNKLTKQQLIERVAALTVEWYRTQAIARSMRQLLNREYAQFFRVHGEPEPSHRRINPDDPAYGPVINFTNQTYERLIQARRAKGSAKRRLETAVRALMTANEDKVEVPRPSAIRRATASGETLQ